MQQQRQKLKFVTLTERVSAKGTRYMTGWLGEAEIVAFQGPESDWGPTWNLFLQEKAQKPASRPHGASSGRVDHQTTADLFRPLQRRGEG